MAGIPHPAPYRHRDHHGDAHRFATPTLAYVGPAYSNIYPYANGDPITVRNPVTYTFSNPRSGY